MDLSYIVLLLLFIRTNCSVIDNEATTDHTCDLPDHLIKEILSYQPIVDNIIHETTVGSSKSFTYNELADFVDTFGNRIAGSENLEHAIDYMLNLSLSYGLESVHGEKVEVPHWVR